MVTKTEDFSITQYTEVRTATGQLLNIRCRPEDVDRVREIISSVVELEVKEPVTKRMNVAHGGYGRYSRYDIVQHKYAGGGGYIEVLEIKDPPELRWGILIHEWDSYLHEGSVFSEWETLEDAVAAFNSYWGSPHHTAASFPTLRGFKRGVECGLLTPWFYAVGNEELIGDYAFPEGLQDDPVFRFGRQFVVLDYEGVPSVKTCMGTRFIQRKRDYHPYDTYHTRVVYWDDGTRWDEYKDNKIPRPLEEGGLWIGEAMNRFRRLLAGKSTGFAIDFTDGTRFLGRIAGSKTKAPCAEGRYDVVAYVKGGKPQEGWVEFKPTPKFPDVVRYVTEGLGQWGLTVQRVEIQRSQVEKGGKKWAGVFFSPKTI